MNKTAKKVTILVNKNWETDGVISALINEQIRPLRLPFPTAMNRPEYGGTTKEPRAKFVLSDDKAELEVTVRCIQDLMYIDSSIDPSLRSGSSSEEKYRVLPDIIASDKPDLVISVSTAGYPGPVSRNGSVVFSGNCFIHDGHPENPKSNLKHKDVGKLLLCNVNPNVFRLVDTTFRALSETKFVKTPRNPAEHACCIASHVFTAVSVINVTEYEEYNWADHETMAHFNEINKKYPCNSSETTHGVVKLSVEKLCPNTPVLFVSPITDCFGNFDFEVTPTQNYTASFNAGIVLGQFICSLFDYVKCGKSF